MKRGRTEPMTQKQRHAFKENERRTKGDDQETLRCVRGKESIKQYEGHIKTVLEMPSSQIVGYCSNAPIDV